MNLQAGFKAKSPVHNEVTVNGPLDEAILTYLIAYLPPLIVDDFSKPEKFVPAALFYIVVILLMFRADTVYVNPFFLLCGYRIYRVTLESGRPAIVVTRLAEVASVTRLSLYEIQPSRLYYAE